MYRARAYLLPLVCDAIKLAGEVGFTKSCIPEVGRLLAVLASRVENGLVVEIGTGIGVGAAWIMSCLPPTSTFFTVESDAELACRAQALLSHQPNAHVIHGDWQQILGYGPYDLVFADAPPVKGAPGASPIRGAELVIQALRVGGIAVLDDLSPETCWPNEWRGKPDPVRDFWLNDPRLCATEVLTTQTTATILATRVA